MLTHLQIHNFALVEHLELEWQTRMTVLTGETGAGKSILLDALGLALGDRAESSMVRPGARRAEISVTFAIDGLPAVVAWLEERELEADGECILRRTVGSDGRSRGYINGQPQPIQSLRELGEQLVDIHGQHAHQSLLRRNMQRQLLDDYAGHETLLTDVETAYRRWRSDSEALQQLRAANEEREARLELLRYQVEELTETGPGAGELAELEETHRRLAHAGHLQKEVGESEARLSGEHEGALADLLEQTTATLQGLCDYDDRLRGPAEMVESAAIQAREAATELRHYLAGLESDPEELTRVENRLGQLHDLARKHHCALEALPEHQQALQAELGGLEEAGSRLDSLEADITAARETYDRLAQQLTAGRTEASRRLAAAVEEKMQELGMAGGRFAVRLIPLDEARPAPGGRERVVFEVSANPGQPLRPLAKVASGGELARISLAIQVIAAGRAAIPTLIFDEVDVGVGGAVAEMVGRRLRELAEKSDRQVLCVTHQPQVAAQGHHHLRISKVTGKNATRTEVTPLDTSARSEEIARMLGGMQITEQTLKHAREMLTLATPKSVSKQKR